ncbi:PREDICTED: endocuticle structural glycoprotein SgAbd-2-like [Nicrophorus vespilloides]|uniref:Endocuticle structural glycoprotein SgAbd-2-like n=1 Tax=Nicrophorus vespilloides TaxID=110193 RepID=A0ABM1NG04_NICVS|nr:PREDICTED: endocuticle structural glycoprotein SgAbd-2-like [Nicrophorus vespilloides]
MKVAIVAFAFLAVAFAAQSDEQAPIVSQDSEVNFDGSYHHSYETGNGISAQEQGVLKNAGSKDGEAEEVQGSYQYTAPDGTPVKVQYVANEFGFQPQGDHLPVAPTPPPVPAAILRALEYIRTHPQQPEVGKKH